MSARNGLVGRLVLLGLSEQAAERAVDAFAHELAEKIRGHLLPEDVDPHVPYNRTVRNLADLIDPEVSSNER